MPPSETIDPRRLALSRCCSSEPPVWMFFLAELEINLPGDSQAPDEWALDHLEESIRVLPSLLSQAEAALDQVSDPTGPWYSDCLVIGGSKENPSVILQFSTENDIYGLWEVEYKTLELSKNPNVRRLDT